MKTISIAPAARHYDTERCRVEILQNGRWENFLSTCDFLPIAAAIEPFAQWSPILPAPMRIITRSHEVLCETKGEA